MPVRNVAVLICFLSGASDASYVCGMQSIESCAARKASRSMSPTLRVVHYTREEGDIAPIDEAAVKELLFQRSQLRQDRAFDEADAIQQQLGEMGVTVFDREMKWFVGTGGRGEADERGRRARLGGGGRAGASVQDGYQRRTPGYTREAGDDYPVDVATVERLIEQRTAMRLSRDFDGADLARNQLKDEYGVYLQDRELKWYVGSGGRARRPENAAPTFERVDRRSDGRGYGRSDRRAPAARAPAKRPKFAWESPSARGRVGREAESGRQAMYDPEYTTAERRRAGKRERQAASAAGKAQPYTRDPSDGSRMGADEVAAAAAMVADRLRAKLAREFERADALLAALHARGVSVSDDRRMWRADGAPFSVYSYHEEGAPGDVTPRWIEEAILRRGEARLARNYEAADAILASLEAEGIGLDDARRTWRYLPPPPGGYVAPPRVDLVEQVLAGEVETA